MTAAGRVNRYAVPARCVEQCHAGGYADPDASWQEMQLNAGWHANELVGG